MTATPTKQHLSHGRRHLLEEMQRINYGRMQRLHVRGGEPVFDPKPLVVHEHKFLGDNGPRPEAPKDDFALKAQVVELFAQLDVLGDGVVSSLEIQRGLPFRMTVVEVSA